MTTPTPRVAFDLFELGHILVAICLPPFWRQCAEDTAMCFLADAFFNISDICKVETYSLFCCWGNYYYSLDDINCMK